MPYAIVDITWTLTFLRKVSLCWYHFNYNSFASWLELSERKSLSLRRGWMIQSKLLHFSNSQTKFILTLNKIERDRGESLKSKKRRRIAEKKERKPTRKQNLPEMKKRNSQKTRRIIKRERGRDRSWILALLLESERGKKEMDGELTLLIPSAILCKMIQNNLKK